MNNVWRPRIVRHWFGKQGAFGWIVATPPPQNAWTKGTNAEDRKRHIQAVHHCHKLNKAAGL